MINIACVLRKGGRVGYSADWVQKLQNGIALNVSQPYRFVCLSDCEVPCERIPLDDTGPGWWAKLQLFKRGNLSGPTLFFDLDTVVFGNLDEMIDTLLLQTQFVMWRDDSINISSSAIMYWNGDYSFVYDEYTSKANYYEEKYSLDNQGPERQVGDQALIAAKIPHVFINDLVPSEWIKLISKRDHEVDFSESKILIFKKAKGKPSNMQEHKIVKEYWK